MIPLPPIRRFVGLCAIAALAACADTETFSGSLISPAAVAVMPPSGPFSRPIGVAADRLGGRLRALDLTTGRYAATASQASFLRDAAVPTGRDRILTGVAAVATGPDTVHFFALDTRHDVVLRVPWVDGRGGGGSLVRTEPRLVSVDVDAADVSVAGVTLDRGRTATDTWTFTFARDGWTVSGLRSGTEPERAPATGAYATEDGALRLVIVGTPAEGDTITIAADNGLSEAALPGAPTALAASPDGSRVVAAYASAAGGGVAVFDPVAFDTPQAIPLPAGTRPVRLAFDDTGALWVADAALAQVHRVDVATAIVTSIDLPWPTLDVAPVLTPEGRPRLVLAPRDVPSVWLYDLDRGVFLDSTPGTPEITGMPLLSPVTGLATMPAPYDLPFQRDLTDGEATGPDLVDSTVAVALASGRVVWMQASTGCLVSDRLGPRTRQLNSATRVGDYTVNFPLEIPGTAYLEAAEDTSRHVLVNACAGNAPSESWSLTYDAIDGAWRAEGTVSGEQLATAIEDRRWVSDLGAVSTVIRAGTTVSVDGWRFRFDVIDGILAATALTLDEALPVITFDLPGDPVGYIRPAWANERGPVPEVIVAAQAEDVVVRIDARTATITALWD